VSLAPSLPIGQLWALSMAIFRWLSPIEFSLTIYLTPLLMKY